MERIEVKVQNKCSFRGIRYIFTAMGFLGFCTIYALRVNINVAIVAMVNSTAVYSNRSLSDECDVSEMANDNGTTVYDLPEDGEFNWSSNLQAVILGAFYYGYCISQIPGGRLAEIFSAKWVFGIGTFIPALLTLLTPLAARYHYGILIAIRILEGLAQGVTMPAMHSMLGKWLPDSEKGLLSTIVYSGINIGTVVVMPLSGMLCKSGLFGGWPSAFYVFGIFGLLWFLMWCVLITDTPFDHPCITRAELKYITSDQNIEHSKDLPPIPWMKIFTSVPFLALIVTQIGQDWCFYTFVTDLPTFLARVLHFDIEKNGFLSSFPYLLQAVVSYSVGYFTDMAISRGRTTKNFVRKFSNTVACIGTALGLVGVCLAGCDIAMTVTAFTFALSIGGFCYCGYLLSHLDLSPEYAGTLMGISNTISNLTGFIAPLVVGSLTEEYQTLRQWRIVFYITIVILVSTSLVFLFFASTEKQDWIQPNSGYAIIDSSIEHTQKSYGSVNYSPSSRTQQ